MKRTIKCWGIPYGLTTNKNQTESVTIESKCNSIEEFKAECKKKGHKLTGEPYIKK